MIVSRIRRVYTFLFVCISCLFLTSISTAQPQTDEVLTYEVKPGDTLTKIAADFGNIIWWIDIYEANREKIENPDFIFPGQQLSIPSTLVQYTVPLNVEQLKEMAAMSEMSAKKTAKEADKTKTLEKFREAFNKVVEAEKKSQEKETSNSNVEEQGYQGLGLGGLILDETRSKMGSNFYSVFYKQWQDPEKVQNFTITVSEQPVRSRGTMVQVKIDNQLVFRSRLEPRYYKTEQAAKRAVRICQRRLKRIATTNNELAGY